MAILAVVLLLGAYLVVADVEEAEAADYGIKDVGLKDADQYEILIVTFDIAYPTNLSFTITHDEDGKSVQDYSGTFTQTGQKEQRLVRASYGLSEDVEYTLTVYAPGAELTRQFSLPEAYVAQVIYFVDDVKYGSEFVHVGDLVTEPADPEVPGETFVGWFTADGEEFDFDMPLLADVRLYAAFGEGEEYAIEIDDSIIGGTVIVPSTSYFGVPVAIVAEPDLGYELVSYYVFEADGTEVPVSEAGIFAMPASDVTVGAVFAEIPGEYTVYVVDQNGMTLDESKFEEGAAAVFDVPAREGAKVASVTVEPEIEDFVYDEDSMSGYFTMPASDVTVTVTYEPLDEGVTASVDCEGLFITSVTAKAGEEASIDLSEYIPEGYVATVEGPAGMGYTFEEGILTFVMPEEDVYFNLVLEVEEFTVAFYDGEDLIGEVDVAYGETIASIPEAPVKEGCEFMGWYEADSEVPFDFATEIYADLDLYAYYELKSYAISIDEGIVGGTVQVPEDAFFGAPVCIAADADEGYVLKSYYAYAGETSIEVSETGIFVMPASDVTVGAVFEEIPAGEYSVKVYYGAVLIVSETAAEGKEMSIDVSRYIEAAEVEVAGPEGLEFQFDDGVLTFVMPGYDVEFAIVDVMYDVTFYVGEEEYDSQVVVSGECAYAPEDPVLAGAVFMGWYLAGADEPFDFDTPITQDLDLYALMEPFVQTFDVEFYVNGGVYRTITVDYGDTVEEIDAPEIPGKTFKGWFLQGAAEPFDFDTPITQDLDLYAKYEDAPVGEEHTVTFYVGDEVFDIQTVKDGELAKELYPPYYPGQQFEGWYEMGSEVPFDFKTPITHDYELYAFYEDVGFTVTFYVDGAEYDKQTVEAGGYAVEPADPVKAGAVFMGWFEPGAIAPFDFETPITQDVALNALFEPFVEEFTVTFYVDVNVYDEQTVPFGGFAIEPEDPVLAGATFIGWFLEGAGEPFDFETPITQDLDLHALFEPFVQEFTVTFYVGEEIYAEQAVPMGGFAIEPEDPVLLGAEFVGWYTVEGELFDFETPITEDLVLIAEFEPFVEKYTVTVLPSENGTASADVTEAEEGDLITITATPDDGYQTVAIYVDGQPLLEGENTFLMPAKNVEVSAVFAEIPVGGSTVTYVDENGVIETVSYEVGQEVVYHVSVPEGKRLAYVDFEPYMVFYIDQEKGIIEFVAVEGNYTAMISYDSFYTLTVLDQDGKELGLFECFADDLVEISFGDIVGIELVSATAEPMPEDFAVDTESRMITFTMPASDVTVTVTLKPVVVETYDVTFYVGEEVYETQTVPVGGFAIEPEDPILLGAEFVGWYTVEGELFDFATPITEDLALIAEFEPFVQEFVVTFYIDDEVYDEQAVPIEGFAIEPEDPVIAGAAFLGWFLEGAIEPFDFETPITQDLDLHALFEPVVEEFTVTFYVNGEVYDVQTVAYNGLAVEPDAPSIEGSEFLGWFLVGAIVPFDFETPITQDLDLYAEFVAYSETVTVSLNQIGSVIYITVTAEDDGAVVKSGEMEIQYTYLVSKMSFGKERLIVMTSPVIKVDIEGGETIAAVEYDLGSEEYLSTISTVWATYTADGIDSEKSAPIIFESVDNAAFLAAKE